MCRGLPYAYNQGGKIVDNKKKGIIGLIIMSVLSIGMIFGTNLITSWLDTIPVRPAAYNLTDGEYHSEIKREDGGKSYVDMVVKGNAITSVVWDDIDADGNKKSVLSLEGKYLMSETGALWAEQSAAMGNYVVKNQSLTNLKLNDEGKTDQVATVSINVKSFVQMVEECIKRAKE